MAWEECVCCGRHFDTNSESAEYVGYGEWVCSPACWESIMRNDLMITCRECGRVFDARDGYDSIGDRCGPGDPYWAIDHAVYCSKKCYEDAYTYKYTVESESSDEIVTAPVETPSFKYRCDYCGKDFNENPCVDEASRLTFCCMGHKAAFKRECVDDYEKICTEVKETRKQEAIELENQHRALQDSVLSGSAECSIDELLEMEGWYHNPGIQYMLSSKYKDDNDYVKSLEWAQKSAAQDYGDGMARLAWHYLHGKGCNQDLQKGFELADRSAKKESLSGYVVLGSCFENGWGTVKSEVEAFRYYMKAATRDYLSAQYNVAECYRCGKGVEKDMKQAAVWYTKVAEQGNKFGQYYLAELYYYGEGVQKDVLRAFSLYEKAAAQGLKSAVERKSAVEAEAAEINKKQEDFTCTLKLAEQGDVKAQESVGDMYYDGINVKKDYKQAYAWYEKAASQGNVHLQMKVAVAYRTGSFIEKNLEKSFKWYLEAAKQNNKTAQFEVAMCYSLGRGVTKNGGEYIHWMTEAARSGHSKAQYYIGVVCESEGRIADARIWYKRAADQGNEDAKQKLSSLK